MRSKKSLLSHCPELAGKSDPPSVSNGFIPCDFRNTGIFHHAEYRTDSGPCNNAAPTD